jgi:YfiR/HmsC-like
MNKPLKIALLLAMMLPVLVKAQDHKIQSLFVYNFAKYIEWPSDQQKGDFIVGVVGEEAALKQFKTTLDGRPKGNQKIFVQNASSVNYKQCHIIFVTSDKIGQLDKVKQDIAGLPIVIVTEKEGALKNGSTINMVQKNGKMGFEIAELPKNSQLKFSSEILRLAKS